MNGPSIAIVLVLVGAASFSAGWVLRDAQARGIPTGKAFVWAALQFVEFPVFLWLYRRIRPRRRLDVPAAPNPAPMAASLDDS
jgi:drug/metabolite transporter (DMT)-like permease